MKPPRLHLLNPCMRAITPVRSRPATWRPLTLVWRRTSPRAATIVATRTEPHPNHCFVGPLHLHLHMVGQVKWPDGGTAPERPSRDSGAHVLGSLTHRHGPSGMNVLRVAHMTWKRGGIQWPLRAREVDHVGVPRWTVNAVNAIARRSAVGATLSPASPDRAVAGVAAQGLARLAQRAAPVGSARGTAVAAGIARNIAATASLVRRAGVTSEPFRRAASATGLTRGADSAPRRAARIEAAVDGARSLALRSPAMVWTRPEEGVIGAQPEGRSPASIATAPSMPLQSSTAAAALPPAQLQQLARETQRSLLLDASFADRLVNDVMGRVDKRLRTERERRGL